MIPNIVELFGSCLTGFVGLRKAMARLPVRENWLIFVDTNILLDFYRLGGESADRQLKALERHKESIITCDQVQMEFLKNRQKVIVDSIKLFKKPDRLSFPPIIADYQPAKMLSRYAAKVMAKHSEVRQKIEKVLTDPTHHDPVFQVLNRIFGNNSALNLRRPNKVRYEIRRLARKRFILGYPPRKSGDTSIGDALNWEWIIKCAQNSDDNHNILIVSRDGDYGVHYDNDVTLNDWLRREFKERVSRKRKIELTNKLTVALKKMDEVIADDDVKEEERIIKEGMFFDRKDVTEDDIMKIFDELMKELESKNK